VGLVPFFMEVGFARTPHVPWLLDFPETNVRTYVRGPGGDTGVWFFSLDAARLAAVITARSTYRLPYFWSKMRVERRGKVMEYETRRRWPGTRGVGSTVHLEIKEAYDPHELNEFDHYLTARWTLYGPWGRRLLMARAEHDPWVLHRGSVQRCDDELVQAAGLPRPDDEPVVHWSPGVDVRIGRPMWVR
jgi:hypothetical protein